MNGVSKLSAVLVIIVLCGFLAYSWTQTLQLEFKLVEVEKANSALQAENSRLQGDMESLQQNYSRLRHAFDELNASYMDLKLTLGLLNASYVDLQKQHDSLSCAYVNLNMSYHELQDEYAELSKKYDSLLERYAVLNASYTQLLAANSSYAKLYSALYEPLQNKTIPTIQELKDWLKEDPTNTITYTAPDFVCGDFAVMLSFHAKLNGWDMGVVAVFGKDSAGKSFNHAFNAIICTEGLVYVEPQTDSVWWYDNHAEITGGWYDFPDFGQVYVEEYIIVLRYD